MDIHLRDARVIRLDYLPSLLSGDLIQDPAGLSQLVDYFAINHSASLVEGPAEAGPLGIRDWKGKRPDRLCHQGKLGERKGSLVPAES